MSGGEGEIGGNKEEIEKDDTGKDEAVDITQNRTGEEAEDKMSHAEVDQGQNPPENGGLLNKDNGGVGVGLPVENNLSIGDQTLGDAKVDADVDGLCEERKDVKMESEENKDKSHESAVNGQNVVDSDAAKAENDASIANISLKSDNDASVSGSNNDGGNVQRLSEVKAENDHKLEGSNGGVADMDSSPKSEVKESKPEVDLGSEIGMKNPNMRFLYESPVAEGDESGTEEEQAAFAKEVENFYKERGLEFKHPKFYKEDVNLLKLWRSVIRLGGYDEVTSSKLWRQVGESFNPPKTCTTVSWTFRIFYEKALLEYERHRVPDGGHPFRDGSLREPDRISNQAGASQVPGSGRTPRDAAARARQGWHSKRLLDSGEVCQPIIKEKSSTSTPKSDRQIRNMGLLKRKRPSTADRTFHVTSAKAANQLDAMVIDIGPPADWVKVNVQKTSDCYEVYALVPGLLREEVHVQSDPAGRLVISGRPEQLDNPWGVTPFKKVVSLPSRIDPHHTSAVVTLHGQLFVRVPFEQSDQ